MLITVDIELDVEYVFSSSKYHSLYQPRVEHRVREYVSI